MLEGGRFELAVGASSRDIRLTATADIVAPARPAALDGTSTLEERLADPVGSVLLRKMIGTDGTGRPDGILGNEELLKVIGNFPLGRLAAFPGLGISHSAVDKLVAQSTTGPGPERLPHPDHPDRYYEP